MHPVTFQSKFTFSMLNLPLKITANSNFRKNPILPLEKKSIFWYNKKDYILQIFYMRHGIFYENEKTKKS